ncbi:MAG: hypothetical protein GY870_04160 [archaeon]|nr:hypothetical protein [archaeon]
MKIFIQFERHFDFFLTNNKKSSQFVYCLNRKASIKDIIESLGVPHTEVGHLDFNNQEIDFSYIPVSQGVLTVHAIHLPFNVMIPSVLRPMPFNNIKFIADINVIKLGRLLILLGFDVNYSSHYSDNKIADIAEKECRIVLTRDTDLLKRKKIIFARRVKANLPYDQLIEVINFFGLQKLILFFSRCSACNIKLEIVEKNDVIHLLEPKTKKYFDNFFQCPQCKKIFWKGSHYENIQKQLSSLRIIINQ